MSRRARHHPLGVRQPMAAPTRYDVDRAGVSSILDDIAGKSGQPQYRTDQIWDGLYQQFTPPEELTNLPKDLRAALAEQMPAALAIEAETTADNGQTVKWLWKLRDGRQIESVLMHYGSDDANGPGPSTSAKSAKHRAAQRTTVCVSTQAGCAMACGFCATGQMGFDRHLSAGEILEQVARAADRSRPRRVSNVVFMGMGEPLANYEPVWTAVERLNRDVGISARRLTVSTVGIVPGIRRLAAEKLPVGLAVSLHAANDTLRNELVPINRRYPLRDLESACAHYQAATGRRLSLEWAMIDGVNDRPQDLAELSALARRLRSHVNLIPLNPTPGYPASGTPRSRVRSFRADLEAAGVNATIRDNRGTGIDAACGQLHARSQTAAQPVQLSTGAQGDG